ncbi:MAG: hypothetical protein AB7E80_07305 [Hyphomicrobiaceae bacterium]
MNLNLRTPVSVVAVSALLLAQTAASFAQERSRHQVTRAEYEACQAQDEAAFRPAIRSLTFKALDAGMTHVDYAMLVAAQWRTGDLDRILDSRIDAAIEEVREESSWGNLISSLASQEKAEALSIAVAERVFQSEDVKKAIEGLAEGVGRDLGNALELASVDAAGPALDCLSAFLGPRYGSTVARTVARDARADFALAPGENAAPITTSDKLKQASGGITGAAILVLRRQMANLARRLGQRLVGSVLARLVSVAAGGVGLVLIAKDIWDLRHGVLPIIADEMKSPETKARIRTELADALKTELRENIGEIADKSTDHVIEVWHQFRAAHAKVLEIAESDTRFRGYLDRLGDGKMARLDEIVAIVLASEGKDGLDRRLADGTLDQAVARLPEPGMEVARSTRSLDKALRWVAVAGDRIGDVVANDIHRRAEPQAFTTGSLARVLEVEDRLAIGRLSAISQGARERLLDLDRERLRSLARSLTEPELEALAGYLDKLERAPRERVLAAVAANPAVMTRFASERVRGAVIASRDQTAAVDMMLEPRSLIDPIAAYRDAKAVFEGRIDPILMWERHPAAFAAAGLVAFLVLLLLWRLLSPRRGRRSHDDGGAAASAQAAADQPSPSQAAKTG